MHCNKKDLMYPSVTFQRASHNLESFTATRSGDVSEKFENENRNFSGSEAREFYENLLKESFDTSIHNEKQHNSENTYSKVRKLNKNKPRINSEKKSVSHDTRQKNLFLKMAQDGDSDGLQRIIRDNKVDINVRDQFGWTALMCAAKSGHKSCIMLLIKEGADVNLKNSQGQTAKDISQQSGLQDLFMFHRRSTRKRKSKIHSELTSDVEQTCQVCKIKFVGPRQEHDTSTAHLFNCQYKSERTLYHIPEDNIGFKIMKQRGWDQEKGLGPEGAGRKYPVKTVLKQDREGLGSKNKKKAKITHFSAGDTEAIGSKDGEKTISSSRTPRRTWKRKIIQEQKKDREWEHNLRVYMNTE